MLVVAAVLGITKGNDTCNLVLDSLREILDGTVVYGCTLAAAKISLRRRRKEVWVDRETYE